MSKPEDQDPDELEFLKELEGLSNSLSFQSAGYPPIDGDQDTEFPTPEPPEGYVDVPAYSCPEFDEGPMDEDDTEALERLQPWVTCDSCLEPAAMCAAMWGHREEVAYARLAALATTVLSLITGARSAMHQLGADTSEDIDLAIMSNVAEMARLQKLIPKLRAMQEGMDGDGGDS